ncbi:MAG: hypothetical protein L3J31_08815 [Bacteroidales bacterium]|nr:hypothetical protein [Bacteroidales bacterium]
MKKIIQISAFFIFVVALSGLMGFIYLERENQILNEIKVRVCREDDKGFLNETALYEMVEATDSIRIRKIKQIKTKNLEAVISRNPYVEKVDAFVNIDNNLMVNVKEKRAILRIFNQQDEGFYLDENGGILPLSNQFTPRVLIASGYINIPYVKGHKSIYDSIYASTILNELFTLAALIRRDNFLQAQINQVYVNSKGEFDLIPQLGNQLIRLGSMENAKTKLDKLVVFYKKALPKAGWDTYKTIDLEYNNQVVCTKK